MLATLMVEDETTATLGRPSQVFTLSFVATQITARDLIRARVYQEVDDYNTHQPEYFRGLVQPTEAEKTLNGFKLRASERIDAERQFQKSLEAFQQHGFILLVDDRQVDDLDEVIDIHPTTSATFLKLVPLVGG